MRFPAVFGPALALAATLGAEPQRAVRMGDLACPESYCPSPDCDTAAYLPYRKVPNCPLLVIGAKGDSLYRVSGSFGVLGWVSGKDLGDTRSTSLSGFPKGATDEPLANPYSNFGFDKPAKEHPFHSVGLLMDTGAGLDTLPLAEVEGLPLSKAGRPSACVTVLRRSATRGLVSAPYMDIQSCTSELPGYWEVSDNSRNLPVWRKSPQKSVSVSSFLRGDGKGSNVPVYASLNTGIHLFSAKFGISFGVKFISSSADTSMPREEDIMRIARVEAADLNADGRAEWVVEVRRWFTDGYYRQLAVLSMGARLHAQVLHLDGFAGDVEGGNSLGTWWIDPGAGTGRRLVIASASEDTTAAPISLTTVSVGKDGRIRVDDRPRLSIAYLAPGMENSEAERALYRIKMGKGGSRAANFRPLPGRTDGQLKWRPGKIATK